MCNQQRDSLFRRLLAVLQELQLLPEEIYRLGQGRAGRGGPVLLLSQASPDWRAHFQSSSARKRGLESPRQESLSSWRLSFKSIGDCGWRPSLTSLKQQQIKSTGKVC